MPKSLGIPKDLHGGITEVNKEGLSYRKIANKYRLSFFGVRHIVKIINGRV